MIMANTEPTEGQRLILDRASALEQELARAKMAKTTAERAVRDQDTVIGILEESLASLRADLKALGYIAPEETGQ
ncbi:hypothetical protein SEA_RIE18_6 [Microbacterium phage Rie18]|nr:hypothetical protein SEA_RIE18_6 [Microbacterium phage Rie18]